MGSYTIEPDGQLRRQPVSHEEERAPFDGPGDRAGVDEQRSVERF